MQIIVPADAPEWLVLIDLLVAGIAALALLVAAVAKLLPQSSPDRLKWWRALWAVMRRRREDRHERWFRRRMERRQKSATSWRVRRR